MLHEDIMPYLRRHFVLAWQGKSLALTTVSPESSSGRLAAVSARHLRGLPDAQHR
jgi:hypothetical protein